MKKQTKYRDRLIKLARHLEKGMLGHEKFNFATFHRGKATTDFCGTEGCAIGECPVVFPEEWEFHPSVYDFDAILPGLIGLEEPHVIDHAMKFFGLNKGEAYHLFLPRFQDTAKFGGKRLDESVSARKVARNIRIFLHGRA